MISSTRPSFGGLIVNGTSTWRTDQLAYGGVKSSGIGREGGLWSLDFFSELKTVSYARPPV